MRVAYAKLDCNFHFNKSHQKNSNCFFYYFILSFKFVQYIKNDENCFIDSWIHECIIIQKAPFNTILDAMYCIHGKNHENIWNFNLVFQFETLYLLVFIIENVILDLYASTKLNIHTHFPYTEHNTQHTHTSHTHTFWFSERKEFQISMKPRDKWMYLLHT